MIKFLPKIYDLPHFPTMYFLYRFIVLGMDSLLWNGHQTQRPAGPTHNSHGNEILQKQWKTDGKIEGKENGCKISSRQDTVIVITS